MFKRSGLSRRRLIIMTLVTAAILLAPAAATLLGQRVPRFRIKEQSAREYFKKGLSFHNQRQYVAAREFFYKALDIYPSFHLARRYLGDAYYYSGEWNAALEQWEFLHAHAGGAYPLVRQRSELLRFYLNRFKRPGRFVYLDAFTPSKWRGYSFEHPVDTAMDSRNNLYILSYQSANIISVNPGGEPRRLINGPFYDRLKGPLAMALKDDVIHIADYAADRVRAFTTTGRNLEAFGETVSGPGQFRGPSGIVVTKKHIFVSDAGNRRVQKFDRTGKFTQSFGADGAGVRPEVPAGLTMDARGTLYLADTAGGRILKYDVDGNYLGDIRSMHMREPRGLSMMGEKLVIADEKSGVLFYALDKSKWTKLEGLRNSKDRPVLFNRAFSARGNQNGILHVAEYGSHRVMTIVPRGLRISNLDVKIERVDATNFPDMAVWLTIKDRLGRPIKGLTRRDIRLYENGNRIGDSRTDNIKIFNQRTNIAIAKENSKFLADNYTSFLPMAMRPLLDPLRVSDRLKVVRVGEQVRLVYQGLQRREILRILGKGDTTSSPNLGKGLYEAVTRLSNELGPRAAVLVVSGKSFPGAFNQYTTQRIIQFARANSVNIHVISFEGEPKPPLRKRMRELYRGIAAGTDGRYYRAFDETALKKIYQDIRAGADQRYLITYTGQADKRLSGRYVDVEARIKYLKTLGIGDGGYFVP